MSRSRRGGGDLRLGGDLESRREGPRSKSLPLPLPPRSPPRKPLPPPRPRSGRSARSLRRKESIMSFCSLASRRRASAAAFESCSCCSSNFFASSNSRGTPIGLSWALSIKSHNSLQKAAVSLFKKPVSWICISLILGNWFCSTKL